MKDVIFRFKTKEDYQYFLDDIREDNKTENFMTEEENESSIIMTFVDSEEYKVSKKEVGGGGTI